MSDTKTKLKDINGRLVGLFRAEQPTMKAFKGLGDAAMREGKVSAATKEMIAVAIAVARGCDDCIIYHVAEAKGHSADRESLVEILAVTVEMSGGPGAVYAAKALAAFDDL